MLIVRRALQLQPQVCWVTQNDYSPPFRDDENTRKLGGRGQQSGLVNNWVDTTLPWMPLMKQITDGNFITCHGETAI